METIRHVKGSAEMFDWVGFTEERPPSGHAAIIIRGYGATVMLLWHSPTWTQKLWSSATVITGFLAAPLTRTLFTQFPQCGQTTQLILVPNFFYYRVMEATELERTFKAAETFL